jgi:hypothetical protein
VGAEDGYGRNPSPSNADSLASRSTGRLNDCPGEASVIACPDRLGRVKFNMTPRFKADRFAVSPAARHLTERDRDAPVLGRTEVVFIRAERLMKWPASSACSR